MSEAHRGRSAARAWNGEDGMNLKRVGLCALVLTLLSVGAVQAQYSGGGPGSSAPGTLPPPTPVPDNMVPPNPNGLLPGPGPGPGPVVGMTQPGLSPWILGSTSAPHDCCGPLGGCGPLAYEIYLRNGVSVPVEGGAFGGHALEAGWMVQGGGRLLLFNVPTDAAWTADFGIGNIHNQGQRSDIQFPLHNISVPNPIAGGPSIILDNVPVTIASYNRTYVNGALGREWYLMGNAFGPGLKWRVGLDGGGRWGSGKLELHELRHRTSVFESVFFSPHTDVEIPCGCCIFQAGFRAEWDYTWTHILQSQNDTDFMSINFLGTVGVRF